MNFFDWNKIDFKQARPGIRYKTIRGKSAQMFYFKFEPGQSSTNHNHPEEQMGYILAGEAEFTIGNEKKICKAGDAYYIPCNISHVIKALNENHLEYIEIFSPPKKEHANL